MFNSDRKKGYRGYSVKHYIGDLKRNAKLCENVNISSFREEKSKEERVQCSTLDAEGESSNKLVIIVNAGNKRCSLFGGSKTA